MVVKMVFTDVTSPSRVGHVWVVEEGGWPVLVVDGVVQSVHPDLAAGGYWAAMLPEVRPHRALLLGFGGGTLAHLLVRRFGAFAIVGVDHNPEMLAAGRRAFGLPPAGVQLVVADALTFVDGCPGRFDFVAVELSMGM